MNYILLTCICCAQKFKGYFQNEQSKCFAEVCDVCPECYELGCPGISPHSKKDIHNCLKINGQKLEAK